jgi:glycosyltransferase involved in cell wall biosynthesis
MSQTVALVVIARNEAGRIGRLLNSVAPWVDRMLVLDTGSNDDTVALAQAAGAQVLPFAWCDDFSAARNAALAAADADWHLVLDADEWLIAGGESVAALRHQPPSFVGTVERLDAFDDGQHQIGHCRISRVLPGTVRYAGRVHEQPVHDHPVRDLSITVGHDGYLPADLAAKRGRNEALLRRMLEESPGDAYTWYQLGKELSVYERHAEADEAFARAAALSPPKGGWWLDAVPRWLFSLKRLHRHEEGLALAESHMGVCGESPDFFFALGDLLLDGAAEHPERADSWIPLIEQCWERCLLLGERPDLPGAVAGRGSHWAAHNLALVWEHTGRLAQAQVLRSEYPLPA